MRISQEIKEQVLERDNYSCQSCGVKLDPQTAYIYHVATLSAGKTDDLSNLGTVCNKCNYSIADKIIDVATTPLSKQLAENWFKAYKKSPAFTSIISLLVAVCFGVAGIYFDNQQKVRHESEKKENLNYYDQINQLDETEINIKKLLDFVKQQRANLKSTQDSLESLKIEKEKLAPLVETDRKVVKALFQAQEEKNRANVARERWIGFGLGILASVLASTILMVVKFFVDRGKLHNNRINADGKKVGGADAI